MKKIIITLIFSITLIFAKEYSIIAFSSITFYKPTAKKFIKRFPNGIIKQYSKYIEYKIEPFKTYKDAKSFLFKVKKYYKSAFIITYNPNLGKVLYPKNVKIKIIKKEPIDYNKYLIHCKYGYGCIKKRYSFEVNSSEILSTIHINVKDYLKDINSIKSKKHKIPNKLSTKKSKNIKPKNNFFLSGGNYIFYRDIYADIYKGQKYNANTTNLNGDSANVKFGIMYTKYFGNYWKFFTDDRIILSRTEANSQSYNDIYFDVNELYVKSYYLNDGLTNLLIGRKKIKDFRSWWYDASLDQIQMFSNNIPLSYEAILATRFDDEAITDDTNPKYKLKNSTIFILHSNYEYFYKNNVGLYYMYEDVKPQTDINDRKFSFIGFNVNGYQNKIFYWLNAGMSIGQLTTADFVEYKRGYGFDVGAKMLYANNIYLAGSYAFGGTSFTQPYISTNRSDYLNQNFSFRYYGTVLNPVLENLNIISLYGIYNYSFNQSFIAAFHNYRQSQAAVTSYNTDYFYDTNGKSNNIGNEFDFFYQYLQSKYQTLKVGAGFFLGGDAYDYLSNKNASRVFVNYRYYWK